MQLVSTCNWSFNNAILNVLHFGIMVCKFRSYSLVLHYILCALFELPTSILVFGANY